MEQSAISKVRPGVKFSDIQKQTFEELYSGLQKIGFLNASVSLTQYSELGLGRLFMPHSLGHFLGLYTHDVGECTSQKVREETISVCQSITSPNIQLEPGMVTTIEPGFYFIPSLVSKFQTDPKTKDCFDFARIGEYMHLGGVRIEDNILVQNEGSKALTSVPRTVAQIEAHMSSETFRFNS